MQAWTEVDDQGRQYLVRTGTGVITAVVPVGVADVGEAHTLYRTEIYCDAPHGRPGAIRYSAHPLVAADSPLLNLARAALSDVWPVFWTIQWHRHEWVPEDLPIASLDLATDARSTLAALDRVLLPEPLESIVPDFVPLHWGEAGRAG
jgi:hypothetical protein